MLPTYILFNRIVISFYGLFIAAGIIAGLLLFHKTAKFRNSDAKTLINFAFFVIILGIIGSRLFYVVFHFSEFSGKPWFNMIAFWRGGLMFQGGFLLAVLFSPFFLLIFNLKFWAAADIIAPSLALGQGIGRIGCFFAGCCYGTETSVSNPLAVKFPEGSLGPSGVYLWPSQLIESLGLILLSVFLCRALKKYEAARYYGFISVFYLCGTGLLRFLLDFIRADDRGTEVFGFPPTSVIAMSIFTGGVILAWYFANRLRRTKLRYEQV
jgi:phosphatidylglycerol:prolipoprotein diacylglycerol transferase